MVKRTALALKRGRMETRTLANSKTTGSTEKELLCGRMETSTLANLKTTEETDKEL